MIYLPCDKSNLNKIHVYSVVHLSINTMRLFIFFMYLFFFVTASAQQDQVTSAEFSQLVKDLRIARETKNYAQLADVYFKLALYEEEVNKRTEVAFDYFTRAKQYYDLEKNIAQSNKINRIIARRYVRSGFTTESISIYEELIKYYLAQKDEKTAAFIYHELSLAYKSSGDMEKSLAALKKSIRLNSRFMDSILIIDLNFAKIDNYFQLNEIDSALYTAAHSFKLSSAKKTKCGWPGVFII
ncbi:MAG: hypothetical protein IPN29_05255 [Saprospiraceae bacterium]|nr:hypothetical protein [Saprospiraceae bacterium]